MKIQIINPNTNKLMTSAIKDAIIKQIDYSDSLVFTTSEDGPDTIESAFDECIAASAVMDSVQKGISKSYAAHVIACFGDPGLDAARELSDAPVIGIAEAAMHIASFVSTKFSIVTTVDRQKNHIEYLVYKYGHERKCSKIRAISSPVSSLINETCTSSKLIEDECREAINKDNIGAIVLGCAGMSGLARSLSTSLGVPIIDGVLSGIHIANALIKCGVTTSKYGDYSPPAVKEYRGTYSKWGQT